MAECDCTVEVDATERGSSVAFLPAQGQSAATGILLMLPTLSSAFSNRVAVLPRT